MFAFEMCVDVDALDEWIRLRVVFVMKFGAFGKMISALLCLFVFFLVEKHSSFRNETRWIFWIILQL
jgi:hypothetical protein